jgi:hypothetical protein
MSSDAAFLFATIISVAGTLALVFGVAWFRASRRIRELEHQLNGAQPDVTLERFEAHLSALTQQVDQLASGQEFLSRLVTDRVQPARLPPSAPKVTTPS